MSAATSDWCLLTGAVGELHGAEVSSESLNVARQNNPRVAYDVYDGNIMPYPDATIDVAFAIAVMHHVLPGQWPDFLCETRRVVWPGDLVLVIEHNPLNRRRNGWYGMPRWTKMLGR